MIIPREGPPRNAFEMNGVALQFTMSEDFLSIKKNFILSFLQTQDLFLKHMGGEDHQLAHWLHNEKLKGKVASLLERISMEAPERPKNDSHLCDVCMDREKNLLFEHCHHASCDTCFSQQLDIELRKNQKRKMICFFCRQKVDDLSSL